MKNNNKCSKCVLWFWGQVPKLHSFGINARYLPMLLSYFQCYRGASDTASETRPNSFALLRDSFRLANLYQSSFILINLENEEKLTIS